MTSQKEPIITSITRKPGLAWLAGMNDATIGILNLSLGTQKAANVSGTLWRDAAGTAASQPISGTFTITDITYGRVTFLAAAWANPPVAYFTGFSKLAGNGNKTLPMTAFLVGTGSAAEAGDVIWQSLAAPSFSAATLNYSAAYSDLQSSGNNSASQTTSAGQVTIDGMGKYKGVVDVSTALNPLSTNVSVSGTYAVNVDGSGSFTAAGAANGPWPMVINGVRSYHIIEPAGNTAPVGSVISKQ